jgi:aldose 1-epimerase
VEGLRIERSRFGALPDGTVVERFVLANAAGTRAELTSWGASLVRLLARDRTGRLGDVVLGFDTLEPYLGPHPHLGGTIGRYANRIARGRFPLDGREVVLDANQPPHHLHGGVVGFDRVVWRADEVREHDRVGVCFSHRSPDGDQGYPGGLAVVVHYRLGADDALRIDFEASADAPTVANLTHHSYWNLRDGGASGILDHELFVDASAWTPVDRDGIPTGAIEPVEGTPLDFRSPRRIGERIADLAGLRGGYDHNFVLGGVVPAATGSSPAARLRDPASGRVLEVHASQPGLQLYTGNFLDGSLVGRGGVRYRRHHGLCLETQHFPDSPNHPSFPTTRLAPGETYHHTTVYLLRTDR